LPPLHPAARYRQNGRGSPPCPACPRPIPASRSDIGRQPVPGGDQLGHRAAAVGIQVRPRAARWAAEPGESKPPNGTRFSRRHVWLRESTVPTIAVLGNGGSGLRLRVRGCSARCCCPASKRRRICGESHGGMRRIAVHDTFESGLGDRRRRSGRRTMRPPCGSRPGSELTDAGNDRRVSARRKSGVGNIGKSPHASSSPAAIITECDQTSLALC
jgi:hypothetical protein